MNEPFLTAYESRQAQSDWKRMLRSPAASTITLTKVKLTGGTVDDVYSVVDSGTTVTTNVTVQALQEVVKPIYDTLLRWNILQAGDCVFYTDTVDADNIAIDATAKIVKIVDAGGLTWLPVVLDNDGFVSFLRTRIGNVQVGQVIPCRLAPQD